MTETTERIKNIEESLEKYYESEDPFEQTDLAIDLIQNNMGWLIEQVEQADLKEQSLDFAVKDVVNLRKENKRLHSALNGALKAVEIYSGKTAKEAMENLVEMVEQFE